MTFFSRRPQIMLFMHPTFTNYRAGFSLVKAPVPLRWWRPHVVSKSWRLANDVGAANGGDDSPSGELKLPFLAVLHVTFYSYNTSIHVSVAFISLYFITAFHHCAFSFITAHFVHHCTLKQALVAACSIHVAYIRRRCVGHSP